MNWNENRDDGKDGGEGWKLHKLALSLISKCHRCPNFTTTHLQVQGDQVFLTALVQNRENNGVGLGPCAVWFHFHCSFPDFSGVLVFLQIFVSFISKYKYFHTFILYFSDVKES